MNFHEVIIKGGLGNQIFCLFYAYKLSIKYEEKVCLNLTNYLFCSQKNRAFILDLLYPPLVNEFKISTNLISKILYFLTRFVEKFFIKENNNSIPGDNPFFINYWKKRYIHSGYFQKIDESELDNKCFALIKEKFIPYIKKRKYNYLAIHIRRGDYLSSKHSIHGVINEKYFLKEAMKLLSEDYYDGIKIFSDSPDLVEKDIFKNLHKNIVFDRGGDPIEVFKRMANHKGLIASNSSFSLWAGILGDIKNFSIPYYWMNNVKSSMLGLRYIKRYQCYY